MLAPVEASKVGVRGDGENDRKQQFTEIGVTTVDENRFLVCRLRPVTYLCSASVDDACFRPSVNSLSSSRRLAWSAFALSYPAAGILSLGCFSKCSIKVRYCHDFATPKKRRYSVLRRPVDQNRE